MLKSHTFYSRYFWEGVDQVWKRGQQVGRRKDEVTADGGVGGTGEDGVG